MIEEKILTPILEYFINAPYDAVLIKDFRTKDRVKTIRNMQILIYSEDHDPPHFHVKSKDGSINAKFLLDGGEYMSGKISSKDKKRIAAFYSDIKTQIVMEKIWNKRNN